MAPSGLNICLIIDNEMKMPHYISEIKSVIESGHSIPLILKDTLDDTPSKTRSEKETQTSGIIYFLKNLRNKNFFVFVEAEREVSRKVSKNLTQHAERDEYMQPRSIFEMDGLNKSSVDSFQPLSAGRHTYEFPDDLVDTITTNCDVVLLSGFNRILRGRILTEPKYGVLSYHQSDITKYRGRPSCFFQWINGENEVGITLQQLTEDLDGGKIIEQEFVDISNARSFRDARLTVKKNGYGNIAASGLNNLQDLEFQPESAGDAPLTYDDERNDFSNAMKCMGKNIRSRYRYALSGHQGR